MTCYHPPLGQPGDKSNSSGPGGGGELFEAVQSREERVVRQIKNSSSLILRSTCHFSRGLRDDCGPQEYLFLRKKVGICRRVVGEEKLSKIKVCI